MKRGCLGLLGAVMLLASTGCAICPSPYDYDYNAFGGTWDRADRCRGRVGSAFEPAETRLTPVAEEPPTELVEPTPEQ